MKNILSPAYSCVVAANLFNFSIISVVLLFFFLFRHPKSFYSSSLHLYVCLLWLDTFIVLAFVALVWYSVQKTLSKNCLCIFMLLTSTGFVSTQNISSLRSWNECNRIFVDSMLLLVMLEPKAHKAFSRLFYLMLFFLIFFFLFRRSFHRLL